MGFTHYWYRLPELAPREPWDRFLDDWRKIQTALSGRGLRLAGPSGDPRDPLIADGNSVAFNGVAGQSYEAFVMPRIDRVSRVRDGMCFGFCKTGRAPYDLAVTGCLLVAVRHFPHSIVVTSDGSPADWREARALCQATLGYGDGFMFLIGDPQPLLVRTSA